MEKIIKTLPRLDATNVPDFTAQMNEALEIESVELIVDMEDTNYICSSGLRVFLSTQKKLRNTGGSMIIKHVKPQIMEIFEVTGFSGILNFEYE
ncbi:MAG: STAS domain-containing protein [Lachnospiraceae bacterium]|nr:STAS domain-containing protein [Lachnospiraceae bacterium]